LATSGGCATDFATAAPGGCTATQVGSTKQEGNTTSPLAAALVLKDKFIELLQTFCHYFYSHSPHL
jgi:hypothetical protein